MSKPDDIAKIDARIDEVNDEIKAKRESMRRARRNDDERREALLHAVIDRLKDERASLKDAKRDAKREHGRMPGQVVNRFVALVVDENAAADYFAAEFEDQAGPILRGERTPEQALDIAVARMAREADVLFDFSKVPVIGAWLEANDDRLFEWAIPALLKVGRNAFDRWRASRDKPSTPDAAPDA
jgi:hypothetical protein